MPKVRSEFQARVTIFSCQTCISFKIVVHISFVVKGAFPKDLELVLVDAGLMSVERETEI